MDRLARTLTAICAISRLGCEARWICSTCDKRKINDPLAGHLGTVPVFVLHGRAHFYEGLEMSSLTFTVRVLAALGVQSLLLTNAAGGIRRDLRPGDLVVLTDHINLMGLVLV